MKNDIIIALVGFIMTTMLAWMVQLTVTLEEIDKELAVHIVKESLERERDNKDRD